PSRPTEHWGGWYDCVMPLIDLVADRLSLESYRPAKVVLSRLRAGAVIAEHVDLNQSSQIPNKIHLPIVTSPQVAFTVEESRYHLEPGRAYEINNLRRHAVYNCGDVDRIHLIIEVYPYTPPRQHRR
ncbi:aspartyl/asparaginyl beta-hydroxylase domain-containing protein, partial [Frankia sp. CiP3]|uniref:aspartyl/asparaginyl beta-hydroxylase domain-containing protein n=1 Tax=Frankia sp. CiP3 TaxID=2880971 RepID=UPI001EF5B98F